jgi:signal transduction histidine kinase
MLTGNLEKIAEHGRRADGIVKSMLEHSRGESGERREVDLNNLVEEALNLAYHGARAEDQKFNITLERDFAYPPFARPLFVNSRRSAVGAVALHHQAYRRGHWPRPVD